MRAFLSHLLEHLPKRHQLKEMKSLKFISHLFEMDDLWLWNRHSVAKGLGAGMFSAFLPLPLQTIPAALGAIYLRGNLPLAVACVWISNPVTLLPIVWVSYKLGCGVLGLSPGDIMPSQGIEIWQMARGAATPFFLGAFVLSALSGVASYALTYTLWGLWDAGRQALRWIKKRD